jgi:hypothetical protein
MHEKQRAPSQPSIFAVHNPIFPGEYSQFCPSLAHTLVGFCGEPSVELLAGGHATSHAVRTPNAARLFIAGAYTFDRRYFPSNFAGLFSRNALIPSR